MEISKTRGNKSICGMRMWQGSMKNGEGAMRWLIRKNIKAEFIFIKIKDEICEGKCPN